MDGYLPVLVGWTNIGSYREIVSPAQRVWHCAAWGCGAADDDDGGNGRYCLPGGGIEPYETNAAAVQRELMEEAGIQVDVGPLVHFQEDFFYYDPTGDAWHGLLFYYRCTPLSFDLLPSEQVDDESATNPQWVKIDTLHQGNLQPQEQWLLDFLMTENDKIKK